MILQSSVWLQRFFFVYFYKVIKTLNRWRLVQLMFLVWAVHTFPWFYIYAWFTKKVTGIFSTLLVEEQENTTKKNTIIPQGSAETYTGYRLWSD